MDFVDGELVGKEKLLLFVDTQIIGRASKGGKKKRIRANNTRDNNPEDVIIPTIAEGTVEQEVSSIISLWNFQYNSPSCPVKEPPGRSEALKILLKSNLQKEASRKKNEFEDRAISTLQDGYNAEQMGKIIRFCWEGWQTDTTKRVIPALVELHLRTAVDFLFSHTMLLRGENIRTAQPPNLFTI
jgi:hypothetical protein